MSINAMKLLIALSMLLAISSSVLADLKDESRVTITNDTPIVEGEIEVALKREMDKTRSKEGTADTYGLGVRIKEAFPFLKKYVNDPDDDVRCDVVLILRHEQSPRAMQLLIAMCGDEKTDSAYLAAKQIYNFYTSEQVKFWGGEALKKSIIKLNDNYLTAEGILLLPCFGPETRETLLSIRQSKKKEKMTWSTVGWKPIVNVAFVTDIGLAELGDEGALNRVKQQCSRESDDEAIFFLQAWRHLDDKSLLRLTVQLLGDKRRLPFWERYPENYPPPPYGYTRICDNAWFVLNDRLTEKDLRSYPMKEQADAALQQMAQQVTKKYGL